ncbi:MAG: hypothetical protein HY807_05465 [Nitrospirae bacterium]|nr:hypothetical protein [Nitrospirota bacterium]
MGYSNVALKDKVVEIYPEISENGISVNLNFDKERNVYVIRLKKDAHELNAYLDKKDADDCVDGVKCVSLGIKIGEFIKNFKR